MSNFPNIANPNSINESKVKAQIKTKFESGYVQSRVKYTKSRKKFALGWKYMVYTDLFGTDNLLDHFDANQGGAFSWTHPDSNVGTTFTVRYSDDDIKYSRDATHERWKVTVNLEEV